MAIDPKTAAMLARAAKNVVTKEENHHVVFIILIAVLSPVLLIITFITYILTSPVGFIAKWFLPDELSEIELITENQTYVQMVEEKDADYKDGYGQDYTDVLFEDGITITYYNQFDERWAEQPYGIDATIWQIGSGPVVLAMAVSSMTSQTITPDQMAAWASGQGHCCMGSGSYYSIMPGGGRYYGLQVEAVPGDAATLTDALSAGKLVAGIMKKGKFAKTGNFILLRGITEDGKVLVADPASRERSEKEWDMKTILKNAANTEDVAFWIFSK